MFTFNWRSPRIGIGVFLFACVTAISPALGEQRYSLRILGGLDGLPTEPLAINNRGEVAGGSIVQEPSGQFYHPFRTAPNQPIRRTDDLVYPRSLGFEMSARGINSTGQVVAIAIQAGGFISGRYRTGPDAPLDLVTDDLGLGGGTSIFVGAGIAINGSGQVAGSGNGVAFRTQPQARINLATDNLGALVPGAATYAYAINDLGQVAGASVVGPGVDIGTQHAYRTGP